MAHFEVHITDEGYAEIDGAPLTPAPGQSVHEAVLDELHRFAEGRGAAVEATVNDGPGTGHFVLQVSPDGSSRVLVPEETPSPEAQPAPASPEAPAVPATVTTSTSTSATASVPATAPASTASSATTSSSATASAVATAVARARARATAADRGVAAPAPGPAPAPAVITELPTGLAEQVGRITALVDVGRLDEAFADATALRERLHASMGAEHPHALEARAVEAYIAHLCGEHRVAIVLALGVARIRCGTGDRRAPADVARATAAWQQLDDERALVAHGVELLHMWDALDRRGLLGPGHTELAGRVRRQVDALAAYA